MRLEDKGIIVTGGARGGTLVFGGAVIMIQDRSDGWLAFGPSRRRHLVTGP